MSPKKKIVANPYLIITADDYGMSSLFNHGIEELAELGLITGVSVMIGRPFVTATLLNFPKLSLGLHLELEDSSTKEEIYRQITLFREKFGRLPAYLDGHQHQHLTSHNFPSVVESARNFNLPVRSRFSEDRKKLVETAIATPQNFISWHPDRIPILAERLYETRQYALSELVVHPGYFDHQCEYPYNKERETELTFLKSHEFQAIITPFTLLSYSQAF